MRAVQQFTYPTFIGVCSILAAFADILQNQAIFYSVLVILVMLGGLTALLSWNVVASKVPEKWLSEDLLRSYGVDPSIKKALLPFSCSCLILAAGIYAFSAISAKASEDGGEGALTSVFPILQEVQVTMGRIERDVAEVKQQSAAIKQDTGQLVETVVKWISIDVNLGSYERTTTAGEKHHFQRGIYANFSNETGQIFEDVSFLVTDGSRELIAETVRILPQNGYKHNSHDDGEPYDKISVCLTAKRRGRDEWVQEYRVYKAKQARLTDEPQFELIDATGQRVLEQKPSCSI
ncbi:hypothetical protein DFR52_10859 [Hoeflea marina]|uniref:Uncharacterized protein n=1 Tax=Hoeflea marina TaxID=274592 RepID=A0A317PDS1_9HYPH|nr:hypothetical protein [Hoeflea marina]PWV95795.1 hypothetical protein DFR52_10859 [Hoeflea marina]